MYSLRTVRSREPEASPARGGDEAENGVVPRRKSRVFTHDEHAASRLEEGEKLSLLPGCNR